MPGRRDREEFGQPLDDAEQDDDEKRRSCDQARGSRRRRSAAQASGQAGLAPRSGRGGDSAPARPARPRRAASARCRTPRSPSAPRRTTLSRCSISHWSRVIGAPGSQPPTARSAPPSASGISTNRGARARSPRRSSALSVAIVSTCGPAQLVGLAAMASPDRAQRRGDRLARRRRRRPAGTCAAPRITGTHRQRARSCRRSG